MRTKELLEEKQQAENEALDLKYQEQKVNLYDILEAEKELEGIEEAEEYTQSLEVQKENKVNGTVKYLRQLETWADGAEVEAKRLLELSKSYRNRANSIEKWVKYSMLSHGITEIKTSLARISFRRSEQVVIVDESLIPEKFIKTKVTKSIDKVAIKKEKNVPGIQLVINQNLIIK
jgi:hypothetical protein